jgi:hypothetical protein
MAHVSLLATLAIVPRPRFAYEKAASSMQQGMRIR